MHKPSKTTNPKATAGNPKPIPMSDKTSSAKQDAKVSFKQTGPSQKNGDF